MTAAEPAPAHARLSPEEIARYRAEGFLVRPGVLAAFEVDALRAGAERAGARAAREAEAGERFRVDGNLYARIGDRTVQYEHRAGSRSLRVIQPFHDLDPALDALIDDPRLVDPMRAVLGCERVALFTDKLNLKPAGEGSGFRWHQDSPYWTEDCSEVDDLPNVLVALDDADAANGCLRLIPGSHRRGMLPGTAGQRTLDPLFTDPAAFDASLQVAIEVPAGSLVFFGPHVVHGSQPNRSSRQRRALVITYQPGGRAMFRLGAVREVGTGPRGWSPGYSSRAARSNASRSSS